MEGARRKRPENHKTNVGSPQVPAPPPEQPNSSQQNLYLQKLRESSEAVNCGDFHRAVQLYSEAIVLDPSNHILYTNRSAAYAKIHQHDQSLVDARKARELNPRWSKAYLREGLALQELGQHGDALAAFASGLAQDSKNSHLLNGLIESACKSPLKEKLEPTFHQLKKLKLDSSPFVVISIIGQELLGAGNFRAAALMLEASLKIGTCSLKLRGSVFSALSSAYWGLGIIDKAIIFMQQDLAVAKSLSDHEGECRAYGNLGSAYFTKGHYKEALTNHRFQLVLAMKLKDRTSAASGLSSLGHVYTAIGDYPNALASHKQCVLLLKQSGDKLQESREIGNVGAVYLAMGNFDSAVECHNEHLKIAKKQNNQVEEARAYSNLGSAYHYKRDYKKALVYHTQVLKVAEEREDRTLEARAYAGLGHASRCVHDFGQAKHFHEKQLDNALQTRDKVAEGRACSNLGVIYHHLEEYEPALKLHKVHLNIAKNLGDKASQGRALGNIGIAYTALGQNEQAVKHHKQELVISTEVNDRHSEGATHGNLAVSFQSLGMYDKALHHYITHLNISKELKDTVSESRCLCNIGNFYSARGDYKDAVPFYEQFLNLSQELHDPHGERKACFNLGYAHFALGNLMEAVRYYEQDLSIAKEIQDTMAMARAYCNLGLAHKALRDYDDALECLKQCYSLMNTLKNVKGKFRVMANIGDLLLKMGDSEEAMKTYNQMLQLAKQWNNKDFLATATGALGSAYKTLNQYDKAISFHNQELSIRQEINDKRGECKAHGHLGSVHLALGSYVNAQQCYEQQLEKSQAISESNLEAQACGNLGIIKMYLGQFDDAIGLFEQQLAMLEQVFGVSALIDKGRAFGNLGDCYETLSDYEEAIKCHEQYLAIAQQSESLSDQDKAYRGLGNSHRSQGNLQQALVCFEKRLVVAHDLDKNSPRASAYGELGCLHSLLGNFEQAVSCLEHQLRIAKEIGDKVCESDAACGLGGVYQHMGEYESALKYHEIDLRIAEETDNTVSQCRAYGNLGLSHESLANYDDAIRFQEQHLSIAAQLNDKVAKSLAYSSLGRVHHALENHTQAVQYLKQALQIAEQLGRKEDEAKIKHRLGLALWGKRELEECQRQLYGAAELFEVIRRDALSSSDYKLSLFDLQTACYQSLQRVLIELGKQDEALVVAERGSNRAFSDFLLERQSGPDGGLPESVLVNLESMLNSVSKQHAMVLYFSIAAGHLYSWLLTPRDGIAKFHNCSLSELEGGESDSSDNISLSNISILDQYVSQVRETVGVDTASIRGSIRSLHSINKSSDSESDDEVFQHHLDEYNDKITSENDRTGFLRMVNRNNLFNSSNYSLTSLFSISSSMNGLHNGMISKRRSYKNRHSGKSPLSTLHQYLIKPMEEAISDICDNSSGSIDLVLVLQGDLYLIPFSMLRKDNTEPYMFEKYNLILLPSLSALKSAKQYYKQGRPVVNCSGACVVGNPKLSVPVCHQWHVKEIKGAEYEAKIVSELMSCRPLIGQHALKGVVLNQIDKVEVIHFATHISWKLSAIFLSSSELMSSQRYSLIETDDNSSDIGSFDGPSLSEYLLTAADILNLRLHAKLVVLNSGYTDDRAARINSDGVVGLTRAFLSAGAQCVMYSLWPVPDQASKLLMRTFYTELIAGKRVSEALSHAMKIVQTTKQFSHPSNWGGWVLVGNDVKLNSKLAQMGQAICELLEHMPHCREAMRVLLHLIEKSLQRIHQGAKNPMFTTYQSIENKVGGVPGWKDLLQAVGFKFELLSNGIQPSVFFPQSDPGDRLTQASASLQSLLGLSNTTLSALSKFLSNIEAGEALISVMKDLLQRLSTNDGSVEVFVNVKLWQIPGCHEFLASLGMDLVDVGRDHVTLRLGKSSYRRSLQCALQALVAVFDTQDMPRSLTLDSSTSSLESLSSSHSGSTATSSFSKGSTPPLSPRWKKKSLFNPAEMEKLKITNKMHLMNKGGLVGHRGAAAYRHYSNDPSVYLSHQNKIKSLYHQNHGSLNQSLSSNPNSESDSSECVDHIKHSKYRFPPDSPDITSSAAMPSFQEHEEYILEQNPHSASEKYVFSGSDETDSKPSTPVNVLNHTFVSSEHSSSSSPVIARHKFDKISISHSASKDNIMHSNISSNKISPLNSTKPPQPFGLSAGHNLNSSGNSRTTSPSQSISSTHSSASSSKGDNKMDPAELAKKILTDVGKGRQIIESLQRESFMKSQQNSQQMRQEFVQNANKSVLNKSSPHISESSPFKPFVSEKSKPASEIDDSYTRALGDDSVNTELNKSKSPVSIVHNEVHTHEVVSTSIKSHGSLESNDEVKFKPRSRSLELSGRRSTDSVLEHSKDSAHQTTFQSVNQNPGTFVQEQIALKSKAEGGSAFHLVKSPRHHRKSDITRNSSGETKPRPLPRSSNTTPTSLNNRSFEKIEKRPSSIDGSSFSEKMTEQFSEIRPGSKEIIPSTVGFNKNIIENNAISGARLEPSTTVSSVEYRQKEQDEKVHKKIDLENKITDQVVLNLTANNKSALFTSFKPPTFKKSSDNSRVSSSSEKANRNSGIDLRQVMMDVSGKSYDGVGNGTQQNNPNIPGKEEVNTSENNDSSSAKIVKSGYKEGVECAKGLHVETEKNVVKKHNLENQKRDENSGNTISSLTSSKISDKWKSSSYSGDKSISKESRTAGESVCELGVQQSSSMTAAPPIHKRVPDHPRSISSDRNVSPIPQYTFRRVSSPDSHAKTLTKSQSDNVLTNHQSQTISESKRIISKQTSRSPVRHEPPLEKSLRSSKSDDNITDHSKEIKSRKKVSFSDSDQCDSSNTSQEDIISNSKVRDKTMVNPYTVTDVSQYDESKAPPFMVYRSDDRYLESEHNSRSYNRTSQPRSNVRQIPNSNVARNQPFHSGGSHIQNSWQSNKNIGDPQHSSYTSSSDYNRSSDHGSRTDHNFGASSRDNISHTSHRQFSNSVQSYDSRNYNRSEVPPNSQHEVNNSGRFVQPDNNHDRGRMQGHQQSRVHSNRSAPVANHNPGHRQMSDLKNYNSTAPTSHPVPAPHSGNWYPNHQKSPPSHFTSSSYGPHHQPHHPSGYSHPPPPDQPFHPNQNRERERKMFDGHFIQSSRC